MTKIRRGGYVFVTYVGDHAPRRVHVYRDSRMIVKWDLDHDQPIEGRASRTLLKLIVELRRQGRL